MTRLPRQRPEKHNTIMVRVASHRARQRLEDALGYLPQGFYSWDSSAEYREVSLRDAEKLKGLKGITRARVVREKLHMCWGNDRVEKKEQDT